jgi:hypothetical protein
MRTIAFGCVAKSLHLHRVGGKAVALFPKNTRVPGLAASGLGTEFRQAVVPISRRSPREPPSERSKRDGREGKGRSRDGSGGERSTIAGADREGMAAGGPPRVTCCRHGGGLLLGAACQQLS